MCSPTLNAMKLVARNKEVLAGKAASKPVPAAGLMASASNEPVYAPIARGSGRTGAARRSLLS